MGPRRIGEEYRLRKNSELYEHIQDLETTVRRRRLKFFGHIKIMDQNRLNKMLFDRAMKLKSIKGYPEQIKEEVEKMGIKEEDFHDRERFGKIMRNIKVLAVGRKKQRGKKWTAERRREIGEKMRKIWAEKKKA